MDALSFADSKLGWKNQLPIVSQLQQPKFYEPSEKKLAGSKSFLRIQRL
jgi:hypothetical protein